MTTILVLHGPNMALKGATAIDEALDARASGFGVELMIFQGNSEGALLDELLRQHLEVDGLIINPGVLAPMAWALAEGVSLVKKPTVEVLLTPPPTERGPSALGAHVKAQVHDRGDGGYVVALDLLITELGLKPRMEEGEEDEGGAPRRVRGIGRRSEAGRAEKSIGRKVATPSGDEPAHLGKTIGRRSEAAARPAPTQALSRATLREKLKARLGGALSADQLAGWARTEWSKLNSGGACEESSRSLIDGVLLTVMGGARATDAIVLAQLARLDQ